MLLILLLIILLLLIIIILIIILIINTVLFFFLKCQVYDCPVAFKMSASSNEVWQNRLCALIQVQLLLQ